jgi:hypothetical protein
MTNNFGNNSFGKLTGRKTVKKEIKEEEKVIKTPKAEEEEPEPFEIEVKSWVEDK